MFQRLFILKGIRTVSHLYKMPKSLEQRGVVSAVDSNAKVKAVLTHSFSTDVGENNRM